MQQQQQQQQRERKGTACFCAAYENREQDRESCVDWEGGPIITNDLHEMSAAVHEPLLGSAPGDLTDLFCEFLEVAIHMLLRIRDIYPAEVFERRRHYNVPVFWIRHPELREYIHAAVFSLRSWMQEGYVQKLAVVFVDSKQSQVERFVFQVKLNEKSKGAIPINDLENALRGFLIKLSASEPLLAPLPSDCTFEIVAYSTRLPGDVTEKGKLWISADSQPWQEQSLITPIKSMSSDPLGVQLYIERPPTDRA